ncbi:hypothetical protein [Flammeovirga aprica]|uniref:Lipoprotein n=1 Tax=Flammeovirga aprica JL-4 TaxID=694437 RepID=A0A7X9RZZ6_9BACT|nr:hypothetical protein [Flammeovirga aprica]NME71853.1 hypothetical protein [Flammeovirga aprica JL-4]
MKPLFYTFILLLLLFNSSCHFIDKPYAPHHDYNMLLEYQNKEGENMIEGLEEEHLQEIEIYTLINGEKKQLEHHIKMNHQFEGGKKFSGLYSNQLNAENLEYYIHFKDKLDTLTILIHQNEEQLRWIESIYFNHKKVDRSKTHQDRSLFILRRE